MREHVDCFVQRLVLRELVPVYFVGIFVKFFETLANALSRLFTKFELPRALRLAQVAGVGALEDCLGRASLPFVRVRVDVAHLVSLTIIRIVNYDRFGGARTHYLVKVEGGTALLLKPVNCEGLNLC